MQTFNTYRTKPSLSRRLQSAFTGKMARLIAVTALAAGSLPLMQMAQPALAAGSITGTVFQDFNSNGTRDTAGTLGTAVDKGVAGITVNAYDASGNLQGTTTSVASGVYTLTATGTGPYRIEFSTLPTGFAPSARSGTGGTSVQFVPDGNISNVNFAINKPADFCQNNPTLCTSSYVFGDQVTGANNTASVLASFPYNGTGSPYGATRTPAPGSLATAQQVGTTFGLAYQRTNKTLFTSSFYKLYAGFGPGGPGAIYKIPTTGGSPSVLVAIPNAGTDTHTSSTVNTGPGNNNPGTWLNEYQNWDQVGKSSLGGMALSEDGNTLYVVNLNNRRLYSVDVNAATPTATDRGAIPAPCANAADARPFGLGYKDGVLYVGGICSAQSTNNAANLSAYIYTFNGSTFSGSPALAFSMASASYPHGAAGNFCGPGGTGNWNAWTPTNQFTNGTSGTHCAYPQPMLSDIAFDGTNMLLGIRDRFGDQAGQDIPNAAGVGSVAGQGEGVSAGDILRACGTTGTSWTLESNGSCGGAAGAGVADGQGPGSGEFYQDTFSSSTATNINHNEISSGGVAQVPGFTTAAFTAMNPATEAGDGGDWRAGGVRFNSNANGAGQNFYEVYDKCDSSGQNRLFSNCPAEGGRFGKVSGMGDVIALCDDAPIEIGNRLWLDANTNGIQDPGEAVLPSVIVSLQTPTGTLTTQTDANGNYYFSKLLPNTAYSISVAPGQAPLNGAQLTQANANGQTNNAAIGDVRDSDAALVNNVPTIYYTTGAAGQNNHGLDIGFAPTVSLGNYVWFDTNNNGSVDVGEQPVTSAVAVQLYQDTNNDGVFSTGDTLISSTTTVGGLYNFSNLTPTAGSGTGYLVVLPASNFQSGGALFNYQNSSSTVAGNSDVNNQDHGNVIGALGGAGVVASSVITLTVGGEPAAGVDGTDANGNQTIDFGFYQLTLGNQVWVDTNNDGLMNNGELGRNGVTVQLLDNNGAVIGTTTTDPNGIYTFTNLIPGTYSVQIALPGSFSSSTGAGEEGNPDNNGDNNDNGVIVNGTTVRSNPIALAAGGEPTVNNANGSTTNSTLDFGIVQLASLGNFVWEDTNHDGVQNDGAGGTPGTGLGNVLVTLYDVNGTAISTTQTNAQGFYSFTNLTPGTYSVGFTAPAGYTFTFPGGNASSDADSNAGPNGRTAPFALGAGENNPTIDAGLWQPAPAISLKKYTNGFDADVLPGPYLPIGSAVTWRFDVRNTGNVTLTNVTLTDDKVGAVTCPQTTLAPNELMSCTATGIATAGQYANTGVVTGTNLFDPSQTVSSTDPSHYFGSNAGLTIKKYTNDDDADSVPGPFVAAGSTVTWTYVVVNTGNSALVNVSVTDDVIGAVTCPLTTLAVAESMTCMMTGIAISGQYTNTGTVVATDPNNPATPLTTNDPSHYYGSNAGLTLKKFVNAGGLLPLGDDAQTAPGLSVTEGSAVVWTYVMTNTGNVALTNVLLTDDKIGAITCPATGLAAGESMTCTASGTAIAGQYTNMGTVSANDATNPNGPALTANDPANYFGTAVVPQGASLGNYVWVDVDRDGQQGDPSVEPPLAGVTVTLYNSSGVAIATTTTDASGFYSFTNLVPGTYSVGFTLPPGYVVTQQGSNPASDTDSNVNPATGRTEPVTLVAGENNLTLDAGVVLNAPGISLKKFVNGDDAQTAPGVRVPAGSPVTWTYVIINIGNVVLSNVALSDDKEGAITCPKTTLAVNEEMTCTKTGLAIVGQYTNIGTATATDETNPTGPTLTSADPANYLAGVPQLVIRKSSIPVELTNGQQTVVDIGDRITYTMQVTNTSNYTATNVRISDGIPPGTQFVVGSAVPAQSSGPAPLVWNVGSLAPGATTSVRFAVTVVNRNPVAVQNTGSVVSNETVTTTNSNTVVHVFKPTAVELISFGVSGQRVQWTTGAELNTFGFAIYRSSTSNRSDATLASLEMISAKGDNSRYAFVDAQADAGVSYNYWLVEVETSGATVEYGPVKTEVGANGTDDKSVVINSQLPIANSPVAGGVAVKVDGAVAGVAAPVANSAANAAPARVAQAMSTVNVEAVSANKGSEAVQPVAIAPAQQTAAIVSEPVAPAAVTHVESREAARAEKSASPDAALGTGAQVGAKPVMQHTAVIVAQPKAAARGAAVQRSLAHTMAQTVLLASALAGALALAGGLGLGLFLVVRRKRN